MEDVSIRGVTRETVDGWLRGVDVLYPIDAMCKGVHVLGLVTNSSNPTTIMTESGLYAGAANGRGHPTGTYYDDCNIFNAKTAIVTEGCEGMVARGNQLVNVLSGLRFIDPLGRPLMQASFNHVNAHTVCIAANAASQIQIVDNSLYHTLGTDRDGVGVQIAGASQRAVIRGNCFESAIGSTKIFTAVTIFKCDHGVIDDNTFRPGVVSPTTSNMRSIVLGADARFFKVGDNNVYQNPLSGRPELLAEVNDGGVENIVSGYGARYRRNSDFSIAAGTETTVSFDVTTERVGNTPNASTNPWVVPTNGTYLISFRAQFRGGSTVSSRIVTLRRSNATSGDQIGYAAADNATASNGINITATARVKLRKGEFIYPRVLSSQAAVVAGGDGRTEFTWTRIGD